MDAQDVLYAAERIFAFLDPDRQTAVRSLLERAKQGEKVDNFLIDELRKNPKIRKWLKHALGLSKDVVMAYDSLPGDVGSISAPVYVCPHGDFEWEIWREGQPIPPCPVHNVPLVSSTDKEGE